MTDIQIKLLNSFTETKQTAVLPGTLMDWLLLPNGTLSEDEELATAVRVALGTDALADTDEILPDPDSTDRRGWWGDLDAEAIWDGWAPIGVKNWLLLRTKISDALSEEGSTVQRAQMYTHEALLPFITRQIASRVDVLAQRVGKERIDVHVTMYRGPTPTIELRFAYLWNQVIDR
jgi:phage gp46-like protein